jgi:hypothetical protein
LKLALLGLGAVAVGVVVAAGVLHLTGRGELASGTRIGGIDVGGLTRDGARTRIRRDIRPLLARPRAR